MLISGYYDDNRIVPFEALLFNPLTSRPGCIPGFRYTGVRVLFFVI